MFIATLTITAIFIGIIVLALSVRIIFHRSHRFVETSVGHNPQLRARGLRCPREEDQELHSGPGSACSSCGIDLILKAKGKYKTDSEATTCPAENSPTHC